MAVYVTSIQAAGVHFDAGRAILCGIPVAIAQEPEEDACTDEHAFDFQGT